VEGASYYGVNRAPNAKVGEAPSLPNFWGSILFMHTPFVAELPNLTW